MKIRVTLYTENEKHVACSMEELEEAAKKAWQLLFDSIVDYSADYEKAIVEKCEVIEM